MLQRLKLFLYTIARPESGTPPLHYLLKNPSTGNIWAWKPFSSFMFANAELRKKHMTLDVNERVIEVPWIFSQFDLHKKQKVLDVGYLESSVALSLATAGFQVTGIDIRRGDIFYPNLKTVQEDICQTTLKDKSFDVIILLSTLEHIGLDSMYGRVAKSSSDQIAIDSCHRLLKSGGTLLLTTPVAHTASQNNFMRIYTPTRLKQMLKSFKIESTEFYAPQKNRKYWQKVIAKELPESPKFGVALIKAKKK